MLPLCDQIADSLWSIEQVCLSDWFAEQTKEIFLEQYVMFGPRGEIVARAATLFLDLLDLKSRLHV